MAKASLILLSVCAVSVLEQCVGLNYYWPSYPNSQDLLNYPQLAPVSAIWQPDCDKSKENLEEGSNESSSSSESSSSESSSGESKESKESKEEGSKEESKSSSEEEEGSSSSEEGGKKESNEGSSEESGEKKEAPKKKKSKEAKSPSPRTYTFPPRQVQQIIYSPPSSYAYMPYRTSYLLQQPVASYPRDNYRYITLPTSSSVVSGYSAPLVERVVNNPVAKFVYSPAAVNYPAVTKSAITPGARIYSLPASWGSPVSYFKK